MADNIVPIRPPAPEASFIRGIRACVAMLEETRDADEFHVKGLGRVRVQSLGRRNPQNNVVCRALEEIRGRGDDKEFEGFCAVLTELCAIIDHSGDYSRIFTEYADRRERVLRRRYRLRA